MARHCSCLLHIITLFIFLGKECTYAKDKGGRGPPHIVFILADDLSWRDVGFHSNDVRTPYLDAMAESGLRLNQYYTQKSCSPSRACFMTGRYQTTNGVYGNIFPGSVFTLPRSLPTIAEALKDAGYATYMTGKWHLGFSTNSSLPNSRGFDQFFGLLAGSVKDQYTHLKREGKQMYNNTQKTEEYTGIYTTNIFGNMAINYIEKHAKEMAESGKKKGMFLFVSFTSPHTPHQANANDMRKYKNVEPRSLRKHYAMVSSIDRWVHNIHSALKENNLWENTVLIFTSDNGGATDFQGYNYPLRGGKGHYFEGGIRSPAIIKSPLLMRGRHETSALFHVTDWFPTFLGIAGHENKIKTDGVNQWDFLQNGGPWLRKDVLLGVDLRTPPAAVIKTKSVCPTSIQAAYRRGPWKIITGSYNGNTGWPHPKRKTERKRPNQKGKIRLFNVRHDPYERKDLSKRKIHVDRIRQLCQELKEHIKTAVTPDLRIFEGDERSDPTLNGGWWQPFLKDA